MTKNELEKYLNYCKETGVFTWKTDRVSNKINGKVAGSDHKGYIRIILNNKKYMAHRLAWLYVYGEWPNIIDHINGIKNDNRIENLRNVNKRENNSNTYKHRNGHLVGTFYAKHANRWRARITINSKIIYLGYYNTQQEAHKAYIQALTTLYPST